MIFRNISKVNEVRINYVSNNRIVYLFQVSAAADIYWEGEEDASNEFLEVKHDDPSLLDHLKRIKREWSRKYLTVTHHAMKWNGH